MMPADRLEPTIFVIFGGAGDLAWRKLVPALFDLSLDRRMPARFAIIAVDRADLGDADLPGHLRAGVELFSSRGKANAAARQLFAGHVRYRQGDFTDPRSYAAQRDACAALDEEWQATACGCSISPRPRRCSPKFPRISAPPASPPNASGCASWGPEATQGLLAQHGHSWPQPKELAGCPEVLLPAR